MLARDNRRKANIGEYHPMFKILLDQGQKIRPELFTAGVCIGDFSLRRIPRRGATTEADNNNLEIAAIEIINLCRKKEAERGTEAGL